MRKRRVKILSSSKGQITEKNTNEFLDTLGEEADNATITPMLSFNGPSLWIGAFIDYYEEVEDEKGTSEDEH